MKFRGDTLSIEQKKAYERIAGGDKDKFFLLEEGKNCHCDDGEKQPVEEPVTQPSYEPEKEWWKTAALAGAAGILAIGAIALAICPFDGPVGEAALGTAASATWALAF